MILLTIRTKTTLNSDVNSTNLEANVSRQRESLLSLALILGVSLVLRWCYSHGQSITFDECYEIQLAQESIPHILAKGDGFPPLYAILLRIWQTVFGTDSARAFSMVLGAVCCAAIYQLGRIVDGHRTGLWSAATLAVLPIHLFYSSEARAYSLLFVIATLALSCIILAIQSQRKRYWFAFALLATLGLHTHYLFALFVAVTMTVAFFQMPGKRWYPIAAAVSIWAMIAPLVLLWAPADFRMQSAWAYRVNFGIAELAYTYGSFLTGYTLGPSLRALHGMPLSTAFQQVFPWAMLISTALYLIARNASRRVPSCGQSIPLFFAIALAPVGMGILCNLADVGYQVRYSIWAVIPCVVGIGFATSQAIERPLGKLGTALLAICFAAAILNRLYVDDYRNADLDSVAEYVSTQPTAPILVISGYMAEPLRLYFADEQDIVGIPMSSNFGDRSKELNAVLDKLADDAAKFILVYTREFHEDPDGTLLQQLRERASIHPVREFAGVKLYHATFR